MLTVSFSTANSLLAGKASVPVHCTDDVGLERVVFFLDDAGQWKSVAPDVPLSGTAASVAGIVDTALVPNGPHQLLAQVFDTSGNNGYALLDVVIANVVPVNMDPGVSLWLKEIARPTAAGEAVGNAVKTDGQGNSIVVGDFKGAVRFGSETKTALGGSDLFISKVSPTGNILWTKTFGGSSNDSIVAVAVDALGYFYTTGHFFGTIDLGGGPMTSAAGIYGSSIFVAKYAADGRHVWSRHFGSTTGNNAGVGIAVDLAANVIVTGKIYGEVNFEGRVISTRAGSADGFVLKLAGSCGNYMWAKGFGSLDSDTVKGVATDSFGGIVVVGFSYAGIDFGGGLTPNKGSSDLFIVKYAGSNGQYLWSRVAGGPGPDTAEGVSVDAERNIFVIGSYYGTLTLDGISMTAPFGTGVYVAKYNSAGDIQWAKSIVNETFGGNIIIRGVAVDSVGNVAVTGNASGGVDFGGGVAYGDANIYVAKYSSQGKYLWAKRSANQSRCAGYGIAIDKTRNIVSTGFVQDAVTIDGLEVSSPGPQSKSAFLYKVQETPIVVPRPTRIERDSDDRARVETK